MALVHKDSSDCLKSELDLFTVPPTQTSIEKGIFVEYPPVNSISDDVPLEFFVASSPGEYLDLAQTQLYVQAKVVKGVDSGNLNSEKVGPVNLMLHSIFSQCDISLNDRLVSPSSNTYSYRAYLDTLLNFGSDAKRSQLTSALYYKDKAGSVLVMDQDDPTVSADNTSHNDGLTKRSKFISKSKIVDLLGSLHSDMFMQQRLLLPGVDLKVKLIRSDAAFCLMSNELNPSFKVKVIKAALFIRKVKVSPVLLSSHMKALEKNTAKYPIARTEIRAFTVPVGSHNITKDNLSMGQLPTKLIVGMVDNDAYTGTFTKNPFNFQHYDLNYISLYLDGEQIPIKPYTPIFNSDLAIRGYNSLFSALGMNFKDSGLDISREEYAKGGYCLFGFDLTADCGGSGEYFSLIKSGNLRLEIRFQSQLPRAVTVVCYLTYDNIVQIDSHRNILVDYL